MEQHVCNPSPAASLVASSVAASMATRLRINANCSSVAKASKRPPINFFYSHFHNSIRNELDLLSQSMSELSSASQENIHERLTILKNRYRFLEQVYKYHSSVEDEVAFAVTCCLAKLCVSVIVQYWIAGPRQFAAGLSMLPDKKAFGFAPAGSLPYS